MPQQVLVLNQNYEPLNVCHTHRAVVLLISGKAEIVLDSRGYILTPVAKYPRPSVIRLSHQVHRPRPRLKLSRRAVFRRDCFTCQYCGIQSNHLTIDHIIPRHRGGKHVWDNVVSACPSCNRRKGGKTLEEARMALHHKAAEPSASMRALFTHYLNEYEDWEPFLSG
ncbi:MAG: HNH endonuclease [Chloroflexota bacterium]|nr:HNH endonuclease [Chloroflexota bacterium]